MKKKHLLIVLGVLAWIVAGADLATNIYVNHQKVAALQTTSQTQLIDKQEASLQKQLQASKTQVSQDSQKLVSITQQACNDLGNVQALLAKNKLSVPVSIPSFCE